MNKLYETVYTMTDYWDGPRSGIANYRNQPHVYQSEFDYDQDEWSDIFLLKPIDDETFRLALEAWQIWLRWEEALRASQSGLERKMNPALPQDRQRCDELNVILESRLQVDPKNALRVKGNFKFRELEDIKKEWTPLLVNWISIDEISS